MSARPRPRLPRAALGVGAPFGRVAVDAVVPVSDDTTILVVKRPLF